MTRSVVVAGWVALAVTLLAFAPQGRITPNGIERLRVRLGTGTLTNH